MTGNQILVVDSNEVLLKNVARALSTEGYEVLTAVDGGGAVTTVRCCRPDLLVLNINYPPDVANGGGVSWDGFLILDWLKRTLQADHIPVVFMTDEDPAQYAPRAAASGALGLFGKPLDIAALAHLIRRVLPVALPA